MGIEEIIESLSYNEKKLLLALRDAGGVSKPSELIEKGVFGLEVEVMGAASWLTIKELAAVDEVQEAYYCIADVKVAEKGLFERRAVDAINKAGGKLSMAGLAEAMPNGDDKIAAFDGYAILIIFRSSEYYTTHFLLSF